MKKYGFLLLILSALVVVSSCTSGKSVAGGCQMNRNMVGYK